MLLSYYFIIVLFHTTYIFKLMYNARLLLPFDCVRTLLLKLDEIILCTSKRTSIQWVIGKQSLKFSSTFAFCFFELDLSTGKSMFAMGEWVDCQRWLKKSKVWSTTQNKKIEFFQPTVQTLDYKIAHGGRG